MRRLVKQHRLLVLLLAALLILCLCGQFCFGAEDKIFIVKSKDITSYNQAIEGFRQQSPSEWTIVEYDLEGTLKNTDKLLKKLKEEQPDMVVPVGAKALSAVTQLKVSYPIVFCMAMNIARYNLEELDITGISLTVSPKDQLDTLTTLNPKIKKIGVLLRQQGSSELLETITNSAVKYKVTITPIQIESEKEIPRKLRSALEEVDVLWMLDDAYILSKESLDFAISSSSKCNLPFMAISEVFVKEGALISLSPASFDNGKQAAQLVRKILKEKTSPRDIPISYHQKPDLVLNLETAKQIGLVIPLELLDKAKKTY